MLKIRKYIGGKEGKCRVEVVERAQQFWAAQPTVTLFMSAQMLMVGWGNLCCQNLKGRERPPWRSGTELRKGNNWAADWRNRADFEPVMPYNERQDLLQHQGLRSAVSISLWERTKYAFSCLSEYTQSGQEQKEKRGYAKCFEVR